MDREPNDLSKCEIWPRVDIRWIRSVILRKIEPVTKTCAPAGFRASRARVELATVRFSLATTARGFGASSAERGEGSPTGANCTTGIAS